MSLTPSPGLGHQASSRTAGPPAPAGIVFDIQHYAVHDGPGIRTLVFLKGCPLRCAWCCNPESQSSRPQLRHRVARCRRCLHCAAACPHGAVSTVAGSPGFDRRICARCTRHECVDACPENALGVTGEAMSLEALVARVAADLNFYRNSGGGVTFSGGEPFGQVEFLRAAMTRCRELGIHTAVETCGHVEPDVFRAAEPLVDLFLFDVKVIDPVRHRELTGVDNELILDNLTWLAHHAPTKVVLRFPLIPTCTDSPANVAAIAELAARLGLGTLHLEPYHALGHGKYAELDLPSPDDPGLVAPETLAQIAAALCARGLVCELP